MENLNISIATENGYLGMWSDSDLTTDFNTTWTENISFYAGRKNADKSLVYKLRTLVDAYIKTNSSKHIISSPQSKLFSRVEINMDLHMEGEGVLKELSIFLFK